MIVDRVCRMPWRRAAAYGGLLMLVSVACGKEWHAVAPAGGGFTVSLPAGFTCGPAELESGWGKLVGRGCSSRDVVGWRVFHGVESSYGVTWFELPPSFATKDRDALLREMNDRGVESARRAFEGGRDGAAEPIPAGSELQVVREESAVGVDGVEGMQFETEFSAASATDGGVRFFFRERWCVRNARLYHLFSGGDSIRAAHRASLRFLNSFEFTEE
jgi:hypothetical protein